MNHSRPLSIGSEVRKQDSLPISNLNLNIARIIDLKFLYRTFPNLEGSGIAHRRNRNFLYADSYIKTIASSNTHLYRQRISLVLALKKKNIYIKALQSRS